MGSNSTRDKIRSATLGSPVKRKSAEIEINGVVIELRQLTIGERQAVARETVNKTMFDYVIAGILAMAYVPGTEERAFETTDIPVMLEQAPGGWFDTLYDEAQKMMNAKGETEKNSEATQAEL